MNTSSAISVSLSSFKEWSGDPTLWDYWFGRGDQPGHQEAEGLGCPEACREEPADPLGHRIHQTGATRCGAYHRGLELPLGCHHSTTHWSHCCWYCSLHVCVSGWKGSVHCTSACMWWSTLCQISVSVMNFEKSCDYNLTTSFYIQTLHNTTLYSPHSYLS